MRLLKIAKEIDKDSWKIHQDCFYGAEIYNIVVKVIVWYKCEQIATRL